MQLSLNFLKNLIPEITYIQESGQISVSDYVRITSTEWYAVLFELRFFLSFQ